MKKEIEQLISKLADKRRICSVCGKREKEHGYCNCGSFLGDSPPFEPITMLDVLEKMKNRGGNWHHLQKQYAELCSTWEDFGFKTSLNEIYEKAEWEDTECIDSDCPCGKFPLRNDKCPFKSVPKDEPTRNLFSFLLQLSL